MRDAARATRAHASRISRDTRAVPAHDRKIVQDAGPLFGQLRLTQHIAAQRYKG